MATGDATRVWFGEIEALLISRWRGDLSGEELAALAADLTESTTRIREAKGILPPTYFCPRCQTSARAKAPVIHVGSMIFAAKRLRLIGDAEVSQLQALCRQDSARQRRALARDKDRACEAQEQPASHCGCR